MNRLKVSVSKIVGACTSTPPMAKGDFFTVDNGDIRIPEGGFVCAWALQNVMPLLPAKERKIGEKRTEDWMWRVHHVQCPDPAGRVVFKIEKVCGAAETLEAAVTLPSGDKAAGGVPMIAAAKKSGAKAPPAKRGKGPIRPLRIVVDEVRGKCTSGHAPGDAFYLDGCRLTLPAGGHFCLYALQAVLPFVAAKARRLAAGDWLADEFRFICPDPAGNVIMRIEVL